MHILGQIIIGLIVGVVAKLLLPGHDPGGMVMTALIGMAGGWVGGWLGQVLGWYKAGNPAGFLMSVAGAMLLLFGYRMVG
jgi:uncharacterized membrane protein YeaQ/YmgE (transglycosylase-associated protein family)